jgi:predicted nuclease with TOPRIM domain
MTIEKVRESYSDDVRLALLEQSINNINDTLLRFEKRFDKIDEKFDKIDFKFQNLDHKFEVLHSENSSHHRWAITGIFGLYALMITGLITVIVKFIH